MKKLVLLLIIVTFIGLDSCKKKSSDPDFCSSTWATELTDEITAVMNTAQAYNANPTTTTCNSYKAALQAYLDGMEKFADCSAWTPQQKAQLDDAIDEAQQDIENACAN